MSYIEGLRALIGHRRVLSPGVRAVIRDEVGAILLQRRGDFGTWGLPAGGVELGESVAAALRREVREETGLMVARAVPFAVYSDPRYAFTYPNGDETQPFTIAFYVEEWSGTPVADGEESLELAFFPLDRLPPAERLFAPHRHTLLDFARFLADGRFIVD